MTRISPTILCCRVGAKGKGRASQTVGAPEARSTFECFPKLFAAHGGALYWVVNWVLLSVLKVKASPGND